MITGAGVFVDLMIRVMGGNVMTFLNVGVAVGKMIRVTGGKTNVAIGDPPEFAVAEGVALGGGGWVFDGLG